MQQAASRKNRETKKKNNNKHAVVVLPSEQWVFAAFATLAYNNGLVSPTARQVIELRVSFLRIAMLKQ